MNACCNLLVLHVAYVYIYIYREREREGGREGESERERERERAAAAAYFSAQLQPSESHNHVVKAIERVRREMAMCGCTLNGSLIGMKTACVLQQTQLY